MPAQESCGIDEAPSPLLPAVVGPIVIAIIATAPGSKLITLSAAAAASSSSFPLARMPVAATVLPQR